MEYYGKRNDNDDKDKRGIIMAVTVDYLGDTLRVQIIHPRIEGKNYIFEALVEDASLSKDVSRIKIDMEGVEYINSLGIAELISIHRFYDRTNNGQTRIIFKNVDPKIASIFRMVEMEKICEIIEKASPKS